MKKYLVLFFIIVVFTRCDNNDIIVPPEYEMIIGNWESYRFEFGEEFPGSHGNNYFNIEEFSSENMPYKLLLILNRDSWEVYSDNTFLCGDKIDGFEVLDFGNANYIYLHQNKKRVFLILYRNGEIEFGVDMNNTYGLTNFANIYFKRIN